MRRQSAGLLPYRFRQGRLEVFLVHPGGPFWANKDQGAWSIPKGEVSPGEEPLEAARREFFEETGFAPPDLVTALGEVKQSGGKRVSAWTFEADLEPGALQSGVFTLEWPPKSGKRAAFPEVDRGEWFSLEVARSKILKSQIPFLDRLEGMFSEKR